MSENDTDCIHREWYNSQYVHLSVVAYNVVTPLYIIFGLIGHLVCLIAFYRQAKKETAYMYQIFATISETIEIFAFILYCMTRRWLNDKDWFLVDYGSVWYSTHMATAQVNMMITTSLLLSVSMAADRVFALCKPFVYKNINHKRHQIIALVSCVTLGVGTSIFDCFRFTVTFDPDSGVYDFYLDDIFADSTTGKALAHIRNCLRAVGLGALIVCNILLTRAYRRRITRVEQCSGSQEKREQQKKTLTLLAIFQSLLNSIGMFFLIAYYSAMYLKTEFAWCQSLLWAPIVDMMVQITDVADFYVVLAVSKGFRKMIFGSLKECWCCCKGSSGQNAIETPVYSIKGD